MLPGFNHNIRYKDRVFHVQTEDNGLQQARLVTQVFIDGQIVALERGSYADIVAEEPEERARTERIRVRMQDQHKGQMKRLVGGELDARIDALLAPASPAEPPTLDMPPPATASPAPPPAPAPALAPAEHHHPALAAAGPAATPLESNPDFLLVLDEEMRRQTPWRPTEEQLAAGQRFAQAAFTPDPALPAAPPRSTARPRPASDPANPPLSAPPVPRPSVRSSQRVAPVPRAAPPEPPPPPPPPAPPPASAAAAARAAAKSPGRNAQAPRPGAGRALPRRPAFPPAGDTIVDMDLPGALKESIARRQQERAQAQAPLSPPAQPPPPIRPPPQMAPPGGFTEAPTPVDLTFRAPRPPQYANPNDTMLEVDAGELRAQVALQRELLRRKQLEGTGGPAPEAPPPPKRPEKRGNIVVVERSLNDVILGYLADDE